MQFVLISGLSGSGKSVALNVLEDSGYYCVDNLPGQLLEQSVELLRRAGHDRVAMSIDARTGESLELVPEYVAALKRQGVDVRLLFLDAKNDTLIRRFSETRRRHPLATGKRTLEECLARERELVAPVGEIGHRIDTTDLLPNALRNWIKELLGIRAESTMLLFESFSYKQGVPLDADIVFDARCLPNPHYDPPLRRDLAAGLRAGQPQLAHGRRRLHRRPAPLGVLRRAPRRSFSRPHSGAGAPPASCPRMKPTVAVALTGASGMPYGLRLIECLVRADAQIYLLYSQAAHVVAKQELDLALPPRAPDAERMFSERYSARQGQLRVFGREDWFAPVASGSNPPDAMVICPCTVGTVAAVAAGLSDTLIERAADVMLKEGRKLILVPRETPFSALHLENMLKLARAGAVILPANPGFYNRPKSVEDLVDFIVARILDHLGVRHELTRRWGEER